MARTPVFPPGDRRLWHYVILTTYGAWLDGDPRGFRTRHRREHVEGDYKNPPLPREDYAVRRAWSEQSLKQPPVEIPVELRPVVGRALRERLEALNVFVLALAVARQHVHLQLKVASGKAREAAGAAKKHAWFALREHGWESKLWGRRGKALRIRDRGHQLNALRYIREHASEGAWVWTWWDG